MPKVSVIIPVYNAEKYLGECLDSVAGQTLGDVEVICVDDGSTDGSAAILVAYAAKDPRIKVMTQQNAGPGPARNRGMDVATGECIAFMDPDDKYPDQNVLEFLYGALSASDCMIAGGSLIYFPDDFPGIEELRAKTDPKMAFPHFGVVQFREYQIPYRYTCFLFRRELLQGVRFPPIRAFQDVPFFANAMTKAGKFLALDRKTYAYRQHPSNGTRNISREKHIDRLHGIRMVMDIAVKNGYWLMFDDLRRRFRMNGRKGGIGKLRLFGIIGLRNELIHRFRKLFGLSRPLALTRKGQSGTCYAAMASDAIRAESSSGGAFTILARKILSRGGAVCGAAFDEDFRCRYEIVRDEASLARLRGSKYVRAALPRSFLADLRTTLESGVPVLFSGTPCHVAAVRRMFADFADSLFTVDLICAGCPDQDLFDRYLDENWGRGNVTKYEFRSKARGWRHHHYLLHVVLKDGREIWRERGEDEFMTAMSSGLGVSAGCFNCPFCTMNRPGDITIGDFWKVPEEMDDGKGTSALLLNTPKGVALFDAVRGDFVKVAAYSPSILEQSQARLRSPRNIPPGRETFWRMLNGGATVKDAADKALPSSSPPKITVIVPVYNAEKYLGECLDSVLGQTLRDIEVVCVDDGSTDGSAAILAEYAAKDSRVKTIAQQNAGPGPARNRGMDVATGECIAFMDPDDKYPDEGTLEFLYSALQDSSCAIAGGKVVYFPADFPGIADQARVVDTKAAFPHFGVVDFREYQCPYRFWCYIFRRNLLDGIRFPALRTFQDVPFFAMVMVKAGRFLALDRTTYAYRQHLGNGTRNLSDGKKIDRLTGIRMVMDIAVKHRYWRMFDDMRRRIRANGQEFGFTKRRLLSLVGLRNEVIYRFRKVAGFTNRVPTSTSPALTGNWRATLRGQRTTLGTTSSDRHDRQREGTP